jgi:two-component system, OmpR family, copper resistance phosphate regulon response regulator CusR
LSPAEVQRSFAVADFFQAPSTLAASRSLEYLLIHQGRVVSREMLARELWKEARHTPLDNVIDVHVARLRRKVDDRFDKKLVHTVRGVGFVVREGAE